jgi:hypothetical protein
MKAPLLLPLLAVGTYAIPAVPGEIQAIIGNLEAYSDVAASVFSGITKGVGHLFEDAIKGVKNVAQDKNHLPGWATGTQKQFVQQHGLTCASQNPCMLILPVVRQAHPHVR